MDLALINQIVSALFQAVELGIKYGPELLTDLRNTYDMLTSPDDLTQAQRDQAEATIQAAHKALQTQLDIDIAADES